MTNKEWIIKKRYHSKKDELRRNYEIKAKKVRLIGSDGKQIGIIDLNTAISMAEEEGLDLVEISPNTDPPVCKIMDYGKYKFEKEKKEKEAKKKQKLIKVKEIKFSPVIGEHDYQFKLKKAIEFLENGDKVLFRLRYKGRQITHKEKGFEVFQRLQEDLKEFGTIEKAPKLEGKNLTMTVVPNKKKA